MSVIENVCKAHDRLREVEKLVHNDNPNIFMLLVDIPDSLKQMGIVNPICYAKSLGTKTSQAFEEDKSRLIPGSQSEIEHVIFGNALGALHVKTSFEVDDLKQQDVDMYVLSAVWQRIRFEFEQTGARFLTAAEVTLCLAHTYGLGDVPRRLKQSMSAAVAQARLKARLETNGSALEIGLNVDKEVESSLVGQVMAAAVEQSGLQKTCDFLRENSKSWLTRK